MTDDRDILKDGDGSQRRPDDAFDIEALTSELAEVFRVARATVNRWEQDKSEIDSNAQVVIRLLAAERLGIMPKVSVAEIAKRSVYSADTGPIRIDGSDPAHYRPIAA